MTDPERKARQLAAEADSKVADDASHAAAIAAVAQAHATLYVGQQLQRLADALDATSALRPVAHGLVRVGVELDRVAVKVGNAADAVAAAADRSTA